MRALGKLILATGILAGAVAFSNPNRILDAATQDKYVKITQANFPDKYFRTYIKQFDKMEIISSLKQK